MTQKVSIILYKLNHIFSLIYLTYQMFPEESNMEVRYIVVAEIMVVSAGVWCGIMTAKADFCFLYSH